MDGAGPLRHNVRMGIIEAERIPPDVLAVLAALEASGNEAYLVGGCVRDLVDDRLPKDYDVATSALADEVARLFPRTIPTGLLHGTVTVLAEGRAVEVTTFRSETGYHDHRRPSEVVFHGDLPLDLARRDFTCNAMAWSPRTGLVDLFGGIRDMGDRILRTVGDPSDRFHEDALRMLRAVRFCCTLGYMPVEELKSACARHAGLLSHVSVERIAAECTRIFESSHPERLADFDGCRILEAAFERVLPTGATHAGFAFGDYLAGTLATFGPSAEAGYALLLLRGARDGTFSLDDLPAFRKRLMSGHRLSARTASGAAALALVVEGLSAGSGATDPERPTVLRRIAASLARASGLDGAEARRRLVDGAKLSMAMRAGAGTGDLATAERIAADADPVTPDELVLTGADFVAKGHSAGPSLGRLRQRLLDAVIEDPARNAREALWALAEGMV
jgi:tRNA nucleotidyltransferase (CCA-adding enzyme)